MHEIPPTSLVMLQVGGLLGLAIWLGVDAVRRRDSHLAGFACSALLLGLGTWLSGWIHPFVRLGAEAASSLAWVVMAKTFFSRQPGRRNRVWLLLLGFLPGLLVRSTLEAATPMEWVLRGAGFLLVAFVTLDVIRLLLTARISRWHFGTVWVALVMVLAGALAKPWVGPLPTLETCAMYLLIVAAATLHLRDASRELRAQAQRLEHEIAAWRQLLHGPTWRSGEPADAMVAQFGSRWKLASGPTLTGGDGGAYRLHRMALRDGEEIGWAEPLVGAGRSQEGPFLVGWSVGLGMEEGARAREVEAWIQRWGGEVTPLRPVPPREAPYPHIIIWAREPSILAVWRELDLGRRRCRWVQIGGAALEGPHQHLDREFGQEELRAALMRLVSPRGQAGPPSA